MTSSPHKTGELTSGVSDGRNVVIQERKVDHHDSLLLRTITSGWCVLGKPRYRRDCIWPYSGFRLRGSYESGCGGADEVEANGSDGETIPLT